MRVFCRLVYCLPEEQEPHIERFMRSVKDECLHRLIFFGHKQMGAAAVSLLAH